jgi:hypothetical protein
VEEDDRCSRLLNGVVRSVVCLSVRERFPPTFCVNNKVSVGVEQLK